MASMSQSHVCMPLTSDTADLWSSYQWRSEHGLMDSSLHTDLVNEIELGIRDPHEVHHVRASGATDRM